MSKPQLNLTDKKDSYDFYEARYSQGYMENWPAETLTRVYNIIKELQLPSKGEALDFGCGNGVLTDIICQALPYWSIFGIDISRTAIANAQARYPGCTFFLEGEEYSSRKFDFIFTHHVFEHVFDLDQTFSQMTDYLKPESSMLHILPCGNEGSFENYISHLRKDGINRKLENRYFFEEEGHVRRLTTVQFCRLSEAKGFVLQKEYYANQYYGAINWITKKHPKFILRFTDPSQAVTQEGRRKLIKERIHLLSINIFRLPSVIVEMIIGKKKKQFKDYILLILSLPFFLVSIPVNNYWNMKAREEWMINKTSPNGSEMYLYFTRSTLPLKKGG